jgi:hypothetical protein
LRPALNLSTADAPKFSAAVKEWTAWYGPRATATVNPAWQRDRLEYRFSMSAAVKEGRVTLAAPEHPGGRIAWDTFTASDFVSGSAGATPAHPVVTPLTAMPALLQIPGMPSPWF